uniref:C2 domain-containing protein n=1 Tax=Anopheles dirus TaxID=7168 RepID=A0A1Y9H281_9DIPT
MFAAGVKGQSGIIRHPKVKPSSAPTTTTAVAATAAVAASSSSTTAGASEQNRVVQPKKCAGSLPPNVDGRARGRLTVGFGTFQDSTGPIHSSCTGIRWNSAKVFVNVDLQLVWWGQKGSAPFGTLNWTQGAKESESIDYEVRTSTDLFRRYLNSCEPIRLRLYSKRTESLIGTAKVQLPGRIKNFCQQSEEATTAAQACGEILSVRGFRLGELCLQFTLKFDAKELSVTEVPAKPTADRQQGKENRNMLCVEQIPLKIPCSGGGVSHGSRAALMVEGKPAPLHESSQRAQSAVGKKFHTLDHNSKRKVLDYLTGKPLVGDSDARPECSERSVLSEICSISPAESMLEALARYDAAPASNRQPYLQSVDCIRVLLEELRLTRAGQKEIQHRTRHQWHTPPTNPAFIVKMKLSRNPGTTLLKFHSASVAFDESEILFDSQPKTTRLVVPTVGSDEGLLFEFSIHLNVANGSIARARLFYLGSAIVTLRELLDGRLSCHKRCPVRLASDDILLGTLTLRMDLGSRGLHFGPELIDAVMPSGGNVTLESSSDDSASSDDVSPEPNFVSRLHCPRRPHTCEHQAAANRQRRHHALFPNPSWTCLTHTGCPADNHSPASNGQPREGSASANQQRSNTAGNGKEATKKDQNEPPGRTDPSGPSAMETETTAPAGQAKLLHGLLYLGQLRSLPASDHFLVCHPFWAEDATTLTSELCHESGDFNYLRTFPVLANGAFIERVRNQHMLVELWQKPPGEGEKLIGVTRLPLHQFYIAFRDAQLSEHLSHAKLPVISIDGWSGIGSPLAAEPCGQIYAVLAIGTESQIEHFKSTRNLHHTSGDAPRTLSSRGALPTPASSPSRRIYPRPEYKSIQSMSSGTKQQVQTSEVANMLSAFIENLAQRLPISSERSTAPSYDHSNTGAEQPMDGDAHHVGSPHSNANRPQLRKTADLLDNLQKALSQRPPATALDGMGSALGGLDMASLFGAATTPADQTPPAAGAGGTGPPHGSVTALPTPANGDDEAYPSGTSGSSSGNPCSLMAENGGSSIKEEPTVELSAAAPVDECKVFRVAIEIEQAVNLPKLTISKKYAKRHKSRNVPEALELEPSAYATFEGYNLKPGMPNTVKSHEGIVYTTHVLERNCAPGWQKRFEVQLPVDLMMNDEKRFILKVWRKAALSDAPKCRLLPAPMEDAVIGFCAIDLSVLLSGMPYILGWYNIMDFSGRCNGQIKVNVQPLENVQVYKTLDEQMNFQIPLSIDVDCGSIGLDVTANSNTSLSRALKRKFTELEEITERLKARLFDVTGDDATDPDDQFERDLNTEADEEDEDETSWPDQLGDMSNQKRNSQYPNGALTLTTNTSSYSMCATDRRVSEPAERSLTGCSNRTQPRLEDLLQTHDIDTLINPAILKNLIHPSTSDETPPLGEDDAGDAATDADMSDEANSSAASLPNDAAKDAMSGGSDKVRQIASALQRTTISDTMSPADTASAKRREAPEGEPMKDANN